MPNKSPKKNTSLDYKSSGVDVEAGYKLVNSIKPFVEKTKRKEIMSGLGSFSAMSKLPSNIKDPVLVTCTDGVGTKIEIARKMNNFGSVGKDLVAMCVNDLVTCGAEPFLFLDYYVTDSLKVKTAASVIEGIAKGCEEANCSLVGGETVEHPNSFPENSFDLAGFAVGIVDAKKIINSKNIKGEEVLVGISSSGPHSNGYSLIRKLFFNKNSRNLNDHKLMNSIMKPTRIYVDLISSIQKQIPIKGMAHITGGGLVENIPRILPKGMGVELIERKLPKIKLFKEIQKKSGLSNFEMMNIFNMGIGFVVCIDSNNLNKLLKIFQFKKEKAYLIGKIIKREEFRTI